MSDSADTRPVVSKKRKSLKSEPTSTTGGDSYKPGELPAPEGSMEAKKRRLVEIIFENSKGLKADELAEQTGLTPQQIKNSLQVGRKNLRSRILDGVAAGSIF